MVGNGIAANLRNMNDFRKWRSRNYAEPSPRVIKRTCLRRNSLTGATWVETGTFRGDTTAFLAESSKFVYSIEPEPALVTRAKERFKSTPNVKIIEGVSETIFPILLPTLTEDINFWLDGHYSAGTTFKGPTETPIVEELESIQTCLKNFHRVSVLIDDVRCFHSQAKENEAYPSLDFLVSWSMENRFHWIIEHDIFIARNY